MHSENPCNFIHRTKLIPDRRYFTIVKVGFDYVTLFQWCHKLSRGSITIFEDTQASCWLKDNLNICENASAGEQLSPAPFKYISLPTPSNIKSQFATGNLAITINSNALCRPFLLSVLLITGFFLKYQQLQRFCGFYITT